MNRATPKMREFAERLMADEEEGNKASTKVRTGFQVVERLRPQFAMLMGIAGFRAILSRALALANAEVRWLRAVHVKADGSLEGLEDLRAQLDPGELFEGRVVLLAQLLGLMAAFIGEDLTWRMMREVWPKVPFNNLDFMKGEKNEKAE